MSLIELGQQLLEAAQRGETELIKQLMCNGAPFTTDWFGTTPLHLAAQNGHIDTAEVLIKAGITIDTKTKLSRAPLHMAAQAGFLDMAKLLIQNGASVNIKDMLNMTPLHWAVESGDLALVEYLLQNGASTSVINKFDKTPIDIAIIKYRTDMVNLLKNAEQIQQAHQEELIIEHDSHHQIPMPDGNGCFYSPLYGTPMHLDKTPTYNPAQNLLNNKRKLQMSLNCTNIMNNSSNGIAGVAGNKVPHQMYNRTALSNNILFAINDNYRLKHHYQTNQQQTLRLLPSTNVQNCAPESLKVPLAQQIKEEFVGGIYVESSSGSNNFNPATFKMDAIKCETTGTQDRAGTLNKRPRVQTANGFGLGPGLRGQAQLCRPGTAPCLNTNGGGGGSNNNTLNIINRDNVKMFLNNLNHFNNTSPLQANSHQAPTTSTALRAGQNVRVLPQDLSRTIILGPSPKGQAVRNNLLVGGPGLVRINTGPARAPSPSSTTTTASAMIYVKQAPAVTPSSTAASKKAQDDASEYPMYILTQTGKIVSSKDLLSLPPSTCSELPSPLLNVTSSAHPSAPPNKSLVEPQDFLNQNILLSPTTEKALNLEAQSALSSLNGQDDMGVPGPLALLEHNKYVQRIYSKV